MAGEYNATTPSKGQEGNLPPFPVECLSAVLGNYVRAVAEHSQTAVDMAAVIGLGVLAVCLQGKFVVEGTPGYREPLSLYTVVIAPPGERKYSVMRDMTQFLYDYEREFNEGRQTEIRRNRQERESLERYISGLQEKLRHSTDQMLELELQHMESQLEEMPVVKPMRFFADDCSSEALTNLLANNDGVLSVISTEGGIFDIMAGRYNNRVNIDVWLKGHCGDAIRVDRLGREPEYIPNPVLSAILTIQPVVLDEIMSNATMAGRGLIARFLYASPPSMISGRRFCTPEIPSKIRMAYHELFDEAVERYNAKQNRQDRCIANYYEKIRSGKQEKPFHELILQIGNRDDCGTATPDGVMAAQILDEYMRGFQKRNPTLRVFSAHLHMDEATPHLHIDFIPYMTGSKRGLDTRVSLKQALAALGFKGGTRGMTEWNQWVSAEKQRLAEIMLEHGIEWEQKGTHEEHLSVLDFKKQERAKEVSELTERKELLEERNDSLQNANGVLQEQLEKVSQVIDTQLVERDRAVEEAEAAKKQESEIKRRVNELAPSIKDLERFADKYSKNAETVLPEAGALESAKTYREKKAKPVYEKIITVLRDIYKQFKDLIRKYNQLVTLYKSKCEDYDRLAGKCQWLEDENERSMGRMRTAERDLSRVRRVLGNPAVDNALAAAEQMEREAEHRKRLLAQQRRASRSDYHSL